MPFSQLGLSHNIVRGVRAVGYNEPTPIQAQAIPLILAGKDLLGTARTGTGKTAAFVLPILEKLKTGSGLRSLILLPTRELAAQVETNVRDYARFLTLRCTALYGGVAMGPQLEALRRGVDIIVATPGRLLDHMGRGTVRFQQLQILVLDEADRMLDMGFLPDIKRILAALPRKRQTLLFGATLPAEIERLARQTLVDPVLIEVDRRATPAEGVAQFLYPVPRHLKVKLLLKILQTTLTTSVLLFTRTKHGADKVARVLHQHGHAVARIHGDRSQGQRSHSLEGFRTGRYKILVATDIAARGLDVEGISHVINYDMPATPEDYIHRIGRTARAQAIGDAFTLVSPEEEAAARAIERLINTKLPRVIVPDFDYRAAAPHPMYRSPQTGRGPRAMKRDRARWR